MSDKCLKIPDLRFSISVFEYSAIEAVIIPKYSHLGGYNYCIEKYTKTRLKNRSLILTFFFFFASGPEKFYDSQKVHAQ